MTVALDHTIVWCRDQERSAAFLAELLDRPAPRRVGPFVQVELDNGVALDFDQVDTDFPTQHLAFLVGDADFDRVFGRIRERGMDHWADPMRTRPGRTYEHGGSRGVYFLDPDGHLLEILTAPTAA